MTAWKNINPTKLTVDRAIAAPIDPLERGWFDWATGLIVLNTSFEAFRAAFSSNWRAPAAARTIATWSHEMTHRQQMVASGFLFWWASGWYDLMQDLATLAIRTFDMPTAHSVMKVGRNPAAYISSRELQILQAHIRPLLVRERVGICILDILEAHALVAEGFSADPEFLIKSAPSPRYSKALELAAGRLAPDLVLEVFPILSAASFMTLYPITAFDRLLAVFSTSQNLCRKIITEPILVIRTLEKVLAPEAKSGGWWGGSAEDQLDIARPGFPVAQRVREVSAELEAGSLKYADLMRPPYSNKNMVGALSWPIFLTGSANLEDMAALNTTIGQERELLDLLYFADMSRRIYDFVASSITDIDLSSVILLTLE